MVGHAFNLEGSSTMCGLNHKKLPRDDIVYAPLEMKYPVIDCEECRGRLGLESLKKDEQKSTNQTSSEDT